jgi:Mrp family chromosome partitioning ATPase
MSGRGAAALRASILGLLGADRARIVLIAGFTAKDNGASVAIGLAKSLAASGRDTVLVEMPGAASNLYEHFGVAAEPGLAEALRTGTSPRTDTGVGDIEALKLVVGGDAAGKADDLSASTAAGDYLIKAKESGAWLVVLTAPASVSPTPVTLAPICDGTVLVATHGGTDRVRAAEVTAAMKIANARVLGIVMGPVGGALES